MDSPSKIALIGPSAPWRGGIAHYTARVFRELQARGHDVTLFNFEKLYPDSLFPGQTQTDTSAAAFAVPNRRTIAPLNPVSWWRTARQVLSVAPERVVFQWWHPFFAPCYRAVAAAVSLAGIDVVFQCHNVAPHESTPLDDILLGLAYGGADAFVVQSEPERDRLRRRIGSERPIRVAAHPPYDQFDEAGMDAEDWQARLGLGADHVVLFFGLVRHYKGLDILLDAMARLPGSMDAALIVAGEHYDDADAYRRQVDALGLRDHVKICDEYIANEDVAGLFDLADACVLPYRHATGSGVANIAMSRGTPLVMSDLPDLVDAFGDAAHWFDSEDPDALAEVLVSVLESDRQPRAPHGSMGGWDVVVDALAAATNHARPY